MLDLSLVILICLCITFLGFIYYDFLHNKNRKILPMTMAVTVLCIFAILELVSSLMNLSTYLGNFWRTGLLAFFLIISIVSLRHAMQVYREGMRSAYYKKLSYTDQMTGCLNRRAYTEREEAWKPKEGDALLMADLNHLKYINDNLGHHAGDAYIMACADAMQEIFHGKGTCYRMGGDEFLFWGELISEEELTDLERLFHDLVYRKCRHISPRCNAATGTAVYLPEDCSIEETVKRADLRMYENKRLIKAAALET